VTITSMPSTVTHSQQQKQIKHCQHWSGTVAKHLAKAWSKEWMSSWCPSTVTTCFKGDRVGFPVEMQPSPFVNLPHTREPAAHTSNSSCHPVLQHSSKDHSSCGKKQTILFLHIPGSPKSSCSWMHSFSSEGK